MNAKQALELWLGNFARTYVVVRQYDDAYHARVHGKTASCTSDAETAVLRAAKKWFDVVAANQEVRAPFHNEIKVWEVQGTWWAEVKGAK